MPTATSASTRSSGSSGAAAPEAQAPRTAAGDFQWGRARFLGDLRRGCQANFTDDSLDNDAFAPHMKLVAYLVRENVLPAGRVVPDAEKILLRRLMSAATPELACECVKLVRLFLEIVAPDPHDRLVSLSAGVLKRIAEKRPLTPPLAFDLPARAASEAPIYLSAGMSRSAWRPASASNTRAPRALRAASALDTRAPRAASVPSDKFRQRLSGAQTRAASFEKRRRRGRRSRK